jgi:hypothetical protein
MKNEITIPDALIAYRVAVSLQCRLHENQRGLATHRLVPQEAHRFEWHVVHVFVEQ